MDSREDHARPCPLDLPGELDVVGDVEVDLEVEHVADALVGEGGDPRG